MAVRSGYKQTEVGVIPEDWEAKPLKRISPQQSVGLVINPSTYFDDRGTVPMLVGSNIKENIILWEEAKRITEGSNNLISASRLTAGDLVTVRVGDPGVTAVVPPELDRCNCASVMVVRKHDAFDSHWLCSVMNSPWGRAQVANVQYGTAQKQFNISDAVNFTYAVPPLPEQRAIATALSDVDALLAKLDQFIAKKRDLKQAAMQQLLTGQTRLPGFSGEWEVKRLGNVAHIKTGAKNNDDKVEDGEYPLFVRSQTIERISTYSYDCEAILVPGEGGIGSIFHYINGKFDCHQRVYKISAFNADTCGKFVFFCMKHLFHKQATRNSVKATVDSLRLPTFLEFEFAAPVREEQQAIVTVLSDMDSELTALESRREKARALKQGMMQELLTGRIRLVSAPRHSPKPSLSAETLADESTQIKNLRRQADFDKSLLLSK